MPDHVCCVCGDPASKSIGPRWFCEKHFQSATHERPHTWRSSILLVVGLVVFVAIVYALDSLLKPVLTGTELILAGVLLALIPALIWMVFFYIQDRLEPEPKGYILGVFLLGAILASGVGIPLVDNFFQVSKWIYTNTAATILGSILVVGFIQEFIKYAAVRYSIYLSGEFDEATDGVIYATAAGLGYATVLNIQFVIISGGAALGSSVIRMVVVALAQASFAGITGYFLGRAKFEKKAWWWMPAGLTLAAVGNGLFNWLRGLLVQRGISLTSAASNPWLGLVLAAVVACITLGMILWLIRRNIRTALAEKQEA
jgi:RsiW-degrading membrane proteinase PrsW (M82 family)